MSSLYVHGATDCFVKVQQVRGNPNCADHDVYTLTIPQDGSSLPVTVHLFCAPGALDRSGLKQ